MSLKGLPLILQLSGTTPSIQYPPLRGCEKIDTGHTQGRTFDLWLGLVWKTIYFYLFLNLMKKSLICNCRKADLLLFKIVETSYSTEFK